MVKSVQVQNLSKALVEKARREGRVVDGRVYATKKEATAAGQGRKAKKSGPKGSVKQGGLPGNREIVYVDKETTVDVVDGVTNVVVGLNGPNVLPDIKAFEARNYKVTGLQFEVQSPLLSSSTKGRIGVAFARAVSEGDKTPAQVAKLKDAQIFEHVEFIDKVIKVKMPGPISANKYDEDENVLTPVDDFGVAIFAIEVRASTGDKDKKITVQFRATLTVDKVAASGSGLTSI